MAVDEKDKREKYIKLLFELNELPEAFMGLQVLPPPPLSSFLLLSGLWSAVCIFFPGLPWTEKISNTLHILNTIDAAGSLFCEIKVAKYLNFLPNCMWVCLCPMYPIEWTISRGFLLVYFKLIWIS